VCRHAWPLQASIVEGTFTSIPPALRVGLVSVSKHVCVRARECVCVHPANPAKLSQLVSLTAVNACVGILYACIYWMCVFTICVYILDVCVYYMRVYTRCVCILYACIY
jgi:hypothetical protein